MASKDSSDKLMLILAVVAVVVAALVFMSSYGFLAPLGVTGNQILDTEIGNVTVNVTSVASIKLNVTSVNFGFGLISPGSGAVLQSNYSGANDGLIFGSATFNRSDPTKNGDGKRTGGLVLENDGNMDVRVDVASNFVSADNYICGGSPSAGCISNIGGFSPQFQLAWVENVTGVTSCTPGSGWVAGVWTNVTSSGGNILCQTFEGDTNGPPTNERIQIHTRMRMNENTPGGVKVATLTFTAQ